ncbi:Fc receptor-like protein 5 isoform X26 [Carassius gibelio]|uniref:Fc receptor-like protein 5 isoform X25 n=1 Tax=Carassius gibelio TaxID=101364 RepID=UPI0022787AE1|nr:Fc receptor-like protein 5 isoform X25 [Carassius gibelio]XP_052407574.1 Fc receptor-like protein 5 isoform X26 [Carassius gibelio]XP_052407577.1 Fc receptor-like protein 5 isoform X25 [Carassius gibelio]XP_052407578.1 Fc receptor-like protein 5 isoform X26 [Carassius gibelio]
MELRQLPLVLLLISNIHSQQTEDIPRPTLTVEPQSSLFTGDSVTLRCEVNQSWDRWEFIRSRDSNTESTEAATKTINSVTVSDGGEYRCRAQRGKLYTNYSEPVTVTINDFPKPTLTVEPQNSLFTGDSVTLRCEVNLTWDRWEFIRSGDSNNESTEAATKTINLYKVSDGGEYRCRAQRRGLYTNYSEPLTVTINEKPKAKVSIKPDQHVFRGETVTLRCDIDGEGVTSWKYSWYKDGSDSVFSKKQEHTFSSVTESDAGKYSCYGAERRGSRTSHISDEVTLTVSDRPRAVLSVSPQKWLTEGDPVTLICEVKDSSTDWTFSWYTVTVSSGYRKHNYQLLSDSSRGAGGNYTVSSAALNHTGVYVCSAEREKPPYYTWYSNEQLLWVTGVSPPVSLIISPNRTQHFTSVSLSLSCEDQSNSDRWTVRRYTDNERLEYCSSSHWGSQTGSTCTISSTVPSDTGVYWCQTESGENSHPVNITVHPDVILESPVHPVTEGDSLTLRCLYQRSTPPILRADFYKDGSLIQNQTPEMIISTVSKSHEGFYYCKHPERGESPKSWISVTERPKAKVSIKPDQHVFRGETVTLRCDIDGEGVTSWKYSWYKDGSDSVFSELQEHTFSYVTESDAGKYSCYGAERGGSRTSHISDEVTLTVSDRPRPVLSVSPQKWLTEGDPVTLICEVKDSSTDWTFSWFTVSLSSENSHHYELLSDSSRGAGGNYTVSSVDQIHTGVYVCKAERGKPVYNTTYSNKQPLCVTGVSPPVSLIISPNRTQHFTLISLSLSCEDQSNSDRWRVRRYTDNEQLEDCSSSLWGTQTGSTCTISSTVPSDTGVYWCQSESGDSYNLVNISVHIGVILESPVHPVTEGDSLTLRCLYPYASPPILRADFYKDGSLIQNQTPEMIISNVSKSNEGFYYCKHPERGESPKSWISVTEVSNESCCIFSHSESHMSVLHTLSSILAVCPYLIVTVVLIFKCCRMRVTSVEEEETVV